MRSSSLSARLHTSSFEHMLCITGHLSSPCNVVVFSLKMIVSLQDYDQSVDPNLVKLADAYDIASAKLKEASQHEEDAAPPAHPPSHSGECMQACFVP